MKYLIKVILLKFKCLPFFSSAFTPFYTDSPLTIIVIVIFYKRLIKFKF